MTSSLEPIRKVSTIECDFVELRFGFQVPSKFYLPVSPECSAPPLLGRPLQIHCLIALFLAFSKSMKSTVLNLSERCLCGQRRRVQNRPETKVHSVNQTSEAFLNALQDNFTNTLCNDKEHGKPSSIVALETGALSTLLAPCEVHQLTSPGCSCVGRVRRTFQAGHL